MVSSALPGEESIAAVRSVLSARKEDVLRITFTGKNACSFSLYCKESRPFCFSSSEKIAAPKEKLYGDCTHNYSRDRLLLFGGGGAAAERQGRGSGGRIRRDGIPNCFRP